MSQEFVQSRVEKLKIIERQEIDSIREKRRTIERAKRRYHSKPMEILLLPRTARRPKINKLIN